MVLVLNCRAAVLRLKAGARIKTETNNAGFEIEMRTATEADFIWLDFVEGYGTTLEALGRSRAGFTTKLHAVVEAKEAELSFVYLAAAMTWLL
jgi:hypothetical protein